MSLNKVALKENIKNLLEDMITREENSIDEFAQRLADSVDQFIRSATIEYQGGLTAPNGAVTGTFNGVIR